MLLEPSELGPDGSARITGRRLVHVREVLEPAFLDGLVRLGLEQGRDTIAPEIALRQRFKPFVEDELEAWLKPGCVRWTPHPGASESLPRRQLGQRAALAIGPEGGWVPF